MKTRVNIFLKQYSKIIKHKPFFIYAINFQHNILKNSQNIEITLWSLPLNSYTNIKEEEPVMCVSEKDLF